MERNREILDVLIPELGTWPAAYDDLDEVGPYVRQLLAHPLPLPRFRQAFWEGGPLQGSYKSYSVFSFWKVGNHQYSAGSFSNVASIFVYFSHSAPIACIGFGPGLWQKQPGRKHAATPPSWEIGEPIDLNGIGDKDWDDLHRHIATQLASAGIAQISIERANAPLRDEAASFEYVEGLELPRPARLKDLLFYEGIDWTY